MKGRSLWVWLAVFAVMVFFGIAIKAILFPKMVAVSPETSTESRKHAETVQDEADIVAENIELVQGTQGALEWKLLAKSAQYVPESKAVDVDSPQLTVYCGKERQEVHVRSDRGEVRQEENRLTLHDNVHGRFGDIEVEATTLQYVGAVDRAYLKGGVTVRRPDMVLTASSVEINLLTRELVALGDIEANMVLKAISDSSLIQ